MNSTTQGYLPPRGADCHAHVYDPVRHPYTAPAGYAPLSGIAGTPEEFLATLRANGLTHGLVVSPGPYGTDPGCLLDAIERSGHRLKGIAVVQETIGEKEIARLAAGGFVGIRLNLVHDGLAPLMSAHAPSLFAKLKAAGWVCQVQAHEDQMVQALPILRDCGVCVVIDHCGRPDAARGLRQPGFQALLELGRSGNAVVKLSGAFRISRAGAPYLDTDEYFRAAIEAFGLANCVWGSDWPFVNTPQQVDYAPLLATLTRWLPEARDRHQVLWENPCRLFGFS
ncbi:MAG TPA: amidohydrolase family protein [Burkholderiales bacterium]